MGENKAEVLRNVANKTGVTIKSFGTEYVIRFGMKRRWGGEKKYAYQCTVGTLESYVDQIQRLGGKIIAID